MCNEMIRMFPEIHNFILILYTRKRSSLVIKRLNNVVRRTLSTCGCQYSSCIVFAGLLVIREKKVGLVK